MGNRQFLHNYRIEVAEQAKVFGCSQVVYFADQGASEYIYERVPLASQEFINYINNRTYLFEDKSLSEEDRDEWMKYGKIIQYADYFDGSLKLDKNDFIDIVYDDFRGLEI